MRTISMQQRRRLIVRRHHLAGDADDPETVTRAVIALHAADPASVYLSVLARSSASTLADVAQALYEQRSLVRWMAMRRTLFVFPREDVPLVQAAVSTPLAATLRKRLISTLERNGAEPPVTGDIADWLDTLASRVEHALRTRGEATGAELRHPRSPHASRTLHQRHDLTTVAQYCGNAAGAVAAGLEFVSCRSRRRRGPARMRSLRLRWRARG